MKTLMSVLFLSLALAIVPASEALANVHGVFRVVKGKVQVKDGKTGKTRRARVGKKVFPLDTIITGKDSRAKVVMVDKNVLNISPDSNVKIENYEFNPAKKKKNVLLNVIYGKVRSKVEQKYDGKQSKFQIKTKSAVAGVRGTDFLASFNRGTQQSQVVTFEGEVSFGQPGPGGSIKNPVSVKPGQMSQVAFGRPPAPPRSVPSSQLASMDKESNADTAKGGNSDERQPANDNKGEKDKKDGKKQDGAKNDKGADGDKKSDAKKDGPKGDKKADAKNNEGPKGSDKKAGNNKGPGGNKGGGPSGGGSTAGGPGEGPSDAEANEGPGGESPSSTEGGPEGPNSDGEVAGGGPEGPTSDGRDPASIDPNAGGPDADGGLSGGLAPPPPPADIDVPDFDLPIVDLPDDIPSVDPNDVCGDACRDAVESGNFATLKIIINQ